MLNKPSEEEFSKYIDELIVKTNIPQDKREDTKNMLIKIFLEREKQANDILGEFMPVIGHMGNSMGKTKRV